MQDQLALPAVVRARVSVLQRYVLVYGVERERFHQPRDEFFCASEQFDSRDIKQLLQRMVVARQIIAAGGDTALSRKKRVKILRGQQFTIIGNGDFSA